MAKSMKMQDQKNYVKRKGRSHAGEKSGADMTDRSKILAIEYDLKQGVSISPDRQKMLDDYKKEQMLKNL